MPKRYNGKRKMIRWGLFGLGVVILLAGLYLYLRINKFKASTTGAAPTIYVSVTAPNAGQTTFGKDQTITADVIVNGGGQPFTSFQADVSTSNINVISVTVNKNLNWVVSPTAATSTSFAGAISGESSSDLAIYTMTFSPIAAGTPATITFRNASIGQSSAQYTYSNILTSDPAPTTFAITSGLAVDVQSDSLDIYPPQAYTSGVAKPLLAAKILSGTANTYAWSASGITLGASNLSSTTIESAPPGKYDVTLTAKNSSTGDTGSKTISLNVRKPGDIDGNGVVDLVDLLNFAKNWSATHPNYTYIPDGTSGNPMADFNHDNKVDIIDLTFLARNFGK